jgi:small GTP-binding protein
MADRSSLTTYVHNKQAIGEALRAVETYFGQHQRDIAGEAVHALLNRLAEDRFNLVVVGQFKRGKSSLINAILGRDILPTAIVPLTSVVTALRYGSQERVLLRREGSDKPVALPLSTLPEYVTERGNPDNEKRVIAVDVEVPARFLRRGLYMIDTPGIGSVYQANTATTYRFLPEADAVIFVTSIESPLTETELSFVDTIRQYAERIFFVLNKVDQVPPSEREEALSFTERLLRERLGTATLSLFPVSARQGLEGKIDGDRATVQQSGIASLEEALATFLAVEKETTLLRSLVERAIRLLAEEQRLLERRWDTNGLSPAPDGQSERVTDRDLDALTVHRDHVVQQLRSRVEVFLNVAVFPSLADFSSAVSDKLSGELAASLATRPQSNAEDAYQSMRAWLQDALRTHADTWRSAHAAEWESVASGLLSEARKSLDRQTNTTEEKRHPLVRLSTAVTDDLPRFRWKTDPIKAAFDERGVEPFFFDLPWPIARGAVRRRLSHDLTTSVAHAVETMRAEVRGYLEGIVNTIQWATERVLEDLRRAVTPPAMPSENSVDTPNSGIADGDAKSQTRQVESLLHRLRTLRDTIGTSGAGVSLAVSEPDSAPTAPEENIVVLPATADSLEVVLQKQTCPVCAMVQDAVWESLTQWQYQLATDEATRRAFTADGGFCNLHTWALEAVSSPHGLCTAYPDLIDRLSGEIERLDGLPASTAAARLDALIPDATRCRLCIFERQREESAVRHLAEFLGTPAGRQRYRRSHGVCLPHLQALLAAGVEPEILSLVLDETVGHLGVAAEDMRGYVLKVDARRRDLLTRAESMAKIRSLIRLAGAPHCLRGAD